MVALSTRAKAAAIEGEGLRERVRGRGEGVRGKGVGGEEGWRVRAQGGLTSMKQRCPVERKSDGMERKTSICSWKCRHLFAVTSIFEDIYLQLEV